MYGSFVFNFVDCDIFEIGSYGNQCGDGDEESTKHMFAAILQGMQVEAQNFRVF